MNHKPLKAIKLLTEHRKNNIYDIPVNFLVRFFLTEKMNRKSTYPIFIPSSLTTFGQPKVEQKLPAVGSSGLMVAPGSATNGNSSFGLKQPFVVILTTRFITQSRHNLKAGGFIFFIYAPYLIRKRFV